MDSSFVSIGGSLTVKDALNKALPYLLDANQQLFEIDSDGTPRLIHLVCSRSAINNTPWAVRVENDTLEEIKKYFIEPGQPGYASAKYNPPRVVDEFGTLVWRPGVSSSNEPPFPSLGKYAFRQGRYGVNNFRLHSFMAHPPRPGTVDENDPNPDIPEFPTFVELTGEQRKRWTVVQEIGTYIIPICYHRTTDKGFESIQVLTSDAQFWPMPPHAIHSMQSSYQTFARRRYDSDVVTGENGPPIGPNP